MKKDKKKRSKNADRENIKRIKEIARLYNIALIHLFQKDSSISPEVFQNRKYFPKNGDLRPILEQSSDSTSNAEAKFVMSVLYTLNAMAGPKSIILWRSYFLPFDNKWWMKNYSKSGYYRIRQQAIEEFLDLISSNPSEDDFKL